MGILVLITVVMLQPSHGRQDALEGRSEPAKADPGQAIPGGRSEGDPTPVGSGGMGPLGVCGFTTRPVNTAGEFVDPDVFRVGLSDRQVEMLADAIVRRLQRA